MRFNYIKQRLDDSQVIPLARKIMASDMPLAIAGHPVDRMSERFITLDDIKKVLKKGLLWKAKREKGSWRYTIKLDRTDLSEDHMVVIMFQSEKKLSVVTVMKQAYR